MVRTPRPSDTHSNREGYLAMVEFLRMFVDRAPGYALVTVLDDVETEGKGESSDPAMWEDWVKALEVVRRAQPAAPDSR